MGLDTYFSITKENSENATLELVELVEDGKDILVTDENKKMFVSLWYSCPHAASRPSPRRRCTAPSTSSARDSTR
jgi:hypothetical protein